MKKQIQKAIAGAITTGMEYVDGLLVAVRDRMADAKETESMTRMQVLQDVRGGPLHFFDPLNVSTAVQAQADRITVCSVRRARFAVQSCLK